MRNEQDSCGDDTWSEDLERKGNGKFNEVLDEVLGEAKGSYVRSVFETIELRRNADAGVVGVLKTVDELLGVGEEMEGVAIAE